MSYTRGGKMLVEKREAMALQRKMEAIERVREETALGRKDVEEVSVRVRFLPTGDVELTGVIKVDGVNFLEMPPAVFGVSHSGDSYAVKLPEVLVRMI